MHFTWTCQAMFLPGDTVGVQQKVLKPWRDLRMKQKKMIPCLRPEPRKVTSNSMKNKNKTMNGTTRSTILHFCDSQSFKASSVGHLRTAVLANAINIGAVSKDHIVSTIEVNKAWTKNDPVFKNKKLFSLLQLQKPTLAIHGSIPPLGVNSASKEHLVYRRLKHLHYNEDREIHSCSPPLPGLGFAEC